MRKIIKRKIHISTHKRDLIDFINDEFYSHDKHNAFIEFTMKSLPTDNIIALFYFQKTKRYVETKAFVDGDKFTIEFDTSLITADETVLGFIYFEKVAQSADVHRFSFGVKVSEIDKLHDIPIQEQSTKRVVAIEDIVTKAELDAVRNAQPQIDKTDLVTKEELEAKGYLTAHQNLEEYAKKSEIPERYNDAPLVERVISLESKAIANGSYDDKPLLEKIHAIEEQFRNASNLYLTSHQSLEHLVTKQELESKGYLTQHQDLSEYAKKTELYNDTALKERVVALENKAPVDLSNLVTRDELDGKHYLTEHQPLTDYAKKTEIPQPYNDTEIKSRLEAIESKNYLTEHQSLENYALKSEIPQAYNDADLKERVTSLEAKALANGAYDDSNLRTRIHALETKEDKDTVYDDADVKRRLSALESKPEVQVDMLVTKQELESKGYLTNHQDISNLATNSKVEAVESRVGVLENKGFLTAHQDLSEYAKKTELPTPYNDTALTERVAKLETKEDKDTVYNDAELRGRVLALESKTDNDTIYNDSELRGRVSALERKEDKDTIYNDEEVKRRLSALENKTDNFVSGVSVSKQDKTVTLTYSYVDGSAKNVSFEDADTLAVAYDDAEIKQRLTSLEGRPQIDVSTLVSKDELASKNYLTNHQDVSGFVTKNELEEKHYLTQHQSLADYALKSELYNDADVKQRLSTLESKNYLTAHQSLEHLVTKQELESKGYLTAHQSLADYATKSELNTLKQDVVTHNELVNRNYLTEHQSLDEYAKKSELPAPYNDTALISRIGALENRPVVNPSDLVTKDELAQKDYLTTHQSLANYALKSELYNDAEIKRRLSTLESKPSGTDPELIKRVVALENRYIASFDDSEIRRRLADLEGEATVHSDDIVTKTFLNSKGYLTEASLTAINRTLGEQNTKISTLQAKAEYEIHGTGMPNGRVSAPIGTTYVDTEVTNGALKWIKQSRDGNTGWKVLIGDTGWRTLNSVSRAGNSFIKIRRVNNLVTYQFGGLQWGWFGVGRRNGSGFMGHGSSGDRGAKVLPVGGIPEGFRSESSLVGPTFNDGGRPYGVWYLGGKSDSNYMQFTFNENIPTDRDIGDIRVSAVSYITEDEWPSRLP